MLPHRIGVAIRQPAQGVLRNLLYEGDQYGRIFIDWTTERLEQGVNIHVQKARSGVTLILSLLAISVLVVVHLLAVRPLSKVHKRLVAISRGKLASNLSVGGSREIAFLAESVDVLRDTLVMKNQREAELERMSTELSEAKDRAEVTLCSSDSPRSWPPSFAGGTPSGGSGGTSWVSYCTNALWTRPPRSPRSCEWRSASSGSAGRARRSPSG